MQRPRPGIRTWLIAAALLLIVVVAFRVLRSLRDPDPRLVLRDSLGVLRQAADSCMADVDRDAAGMRAWGRTLDSMRSRVRELEALDERGVPADSYRIYMETFSAYNDSVGGWPEREDSVRARDARCRALVEHHNELTDSLRSLLLPGDSAPQ